jgi:hypothetical protein
MTSKLFWLCGALLILDFGAVPPLAAQEPSEEVTVRHAPYTIHKEVVLARPFAKDDRETLQITVTKDAGPGDAVQARADACRVLNRRFPPSRYMTVGPDDCAVGATAEATARQYGGRAER